jgi:hypothetical protein
MSNHSILLGEGVYSKWTWGHNEGADFHTLHNVSRHMNFERYLHFMHDQWHVEVTNSSFAYHNMV